MNEQKLNEEKEWQNIHSKAMEIFNEKNKSRDDWLLVAQILDKYREHNKHYECVYMSSHTTKHLAPKTFNWVHSDPIGYCYWRAGKFDLAKKSNLRQAELFVFYHHPQSFDQGRSISAIYEHAEQFDKALEHLRQWLTNPKRYTDDKYDELAKKKISELEAKIKSAAEEAQ
ncbi:MAG: hypothetical protein WCK90_03980 [archaeon]